MIERIVLRQAASALCAVERHLATISEISGADGWVDEILYTGSGFLVVYAVDGVGEDGLTPYHFAIDLDEHVSVIGASEYDLARNDTEDLSMEIPDLMELMQEQDPM